MDNKKKPRRGDLLIKKENLNKENEEKVNTGVR